MAFDPESLQGLKNFNDQIYFNNDVTFYGKVNGIGQTKSSDDKTGVTVEETNEITFTTNEINVFNITEESSTFTNNVILQGTTTIQQVFEDMNLSSTSLTGTVDLDILTGTLFYFTEFSSSDWTFNIRGDSSNTLNSILDVGKSVTVTALTTQGGTAYRGNTLTIDGTTVTPKWLLGITPLSSYTNSINIYTYVILKTADSTFTVLGTFTKFE